MAWALFCKKQRCFPNLRRVFEKWISTVWPYFFRVFKKAMTNNKPGEDQKEQTGQPQNTQGRPAPINPFRDPAPPEENTTEVEADLEQQRKEALTERD
jgi:hypothetical protein